MPAPPAPSIRVALADDSILRREGVARLLDDAGFTVVAQAEDPDALVEAVRADPPDVAIVDVHAPPAQSDEGLQAAKDLRRELPDVGVLVLTDDVDAELAVLLAAERASGLGCLLKDRVTDVQEFTDAVRHVGAGGSVIDPGIVSHLVAPGAGPLEALTDRERQVMTLMAEGRSNRAIAERMFLSAKTVEGHVRRIFNKLDLQPAPDVHRRVMAVLTYLRATSAPPGRA
ncbi:MAG: LuxR C-terminal-related transcriptional regulator [Actinomycetota bacterium]